MPSVSSVISRPPSMRARVFGQHVVAVPGGEVDRVGVDARPPARCAGGSSRRGRRRGSIAPPRRSRRSRTRAARRRRIACDGDRRQRLAAVEAACRRLHVPCVASTAHGRATAFIAAPARCQAHGVLACAAGALRCASGRRRAPAARSSRGRRRARIARASRRRRAAVASRGRGRRASDARSASSQRRMRDRSRRSPAAPRLPCRRRAARRCSCRAARARRPGRGRRSGSARCCCTWSATLSSLPLRAPRRTAAGRRATTAASGRPTTSHTIGSRQGGASCLSHHIGPKKLLSTSRARLPSRRRDHRSATSWRPRTAGGRATASAAATAPRRLGARRRRASLRDARCRPRACRCVMR